jgi:uncharacterized protein (DUF983 family)
VRAAHAVGGTTPTRPHRRGGHAVKDILRILGAGVRLRCPRCGGAPMFRGAFTMHERCPQCGMRFEREQGYFVGAIYVNYAFTVGLAVLGFYVWERWDPPIGRQLVLWGLFVIVFPLLFFRHSRSLWLSIEYLFNPEPEPEPGARTR